MKPGKKRAVSLLPLGLAAALLAWSCSGDDSPAGPEGTGGEPDGDGGQAVTLALLSAEIFTPKCATSGCHTGNNPAADLSLHPEDIAQVILGVPGAANDDDEDGDAHDNEDDGGAGDDEDNGDAHDNDEAHSDYQLIAPGDPVNSYLLMKVRGDERIVGDRMPPGMPLEAEQIALIETWIEAGAPVE